MSGLLSRLDRNRNGMLDPDEMQGRAQSMIDRLAPNVDKSRPISVAKLTRTLQQARGGGVGSSRGSGASSAPEPLVPGFGLEVVPDPVPGFGDGAETCNSQGGPPGSRTRGATSAPSSGDKEESKASVSDRYMASAVKLIKKYDSDKDGVLSASELGKVAILQRYKNLDADGDGKVTPTELAQGMLKK